MLVGHFGGEMPNVKSQDKRDICIRLRNRLKNGRAGAERENNIVLQKVFGRYRNLASGFQRDRVLGIH